MFRNVLVGGVPTFDGSHPYRDFLAFPSSFIGGAVVAAADMGSTPLASGPFVNTLLDGKAEIVVGSGAGMKTTVKVFDVSGMIRPRLRRGHGRWEFHSFQHHHDQLPRGSVPQCGEDQRRSHPGHRGGRRRQRRFPGGRLGLEQHLFRHVVQLIGEWHRLCRVHRCESKRAGSGSGTGHQW